MARSCTPASWPLAFTGMMVASSCLADEGPRHVPSPDWRDQIIYFALIDRFDDGDPGNNDQGSGEYDPASRAHYSGGDLAGLRRRLDYIQGLGATALWITPPVRHQWWDGSVGYGGYHGYWGEHFAEVDPHFGTLADYRALAEDLHARDMRLIQDIVVNHTGNYFSYPAAHDPRDPAFGHERNPDPRPSAAPTQWPFSLNDARDPAQRTADIYHWTPKIADFDDPVQERTWQLASLDDLNTRNPLVRRSLRTSYAHWIREVGVDAFRVDTAFYVEPEFFRDFLHAEDPQAPGVLRVAAATGREDFHVFGEGFGIDPPYEEGQARKIERWAGDAAGPLLPAMINFPLYGSLVDVFARGRPSAVLGHRITSMMRVHARPHLMPSFVDNHDVDRFLAGGDAAGLRLALFAIHSLPGIPTVYYGTEQDFTAPRAAMFAAGHGSGGRDHFDTTSPGYRFLQRLAALRRNHPVLSRGIPGVIAQESAAPGALAWTMRHQGRTALVALNSAPHAALLVAATELAPGTRLEPLFAIEAEAQVQHLDAQGSLNLALPPRSGQVWIAGDAVATTAAAAPMPSIDALPATAVTDTLRLRGRAAPNQSLQLVVDGDLARALPVRSDARGRWQARLDTAGLVDPTTRHNVRAWSNASGTVSQAQPFSVSPRWTMRLAYEDPAGDDHGPSGTYVYPTDGLWRAHRTADLRHVRVASSGGALRIEVEFHELVAGWNPPHGFDHVALTVFLELPGHAEGVRAMPGQQSDLPGDMRWHRRLRVGGWSHALFSAAGADAEREGTPVSHAISVKREGDTLVLMLPAAALGDPVSLDGTRLYLGTWDYDGGFRAIAPAPAAFVFGGAAADAPKVMDDTPVLVLKRR